MTLAAAPAEPELMVGHAPKLGKKHHHEQNEGYGSFFCTTWIKDGKSFRMINFAIMRGHLIIILTCVCVSQFTSMPNLLSSNTILFSSIMDFFFVFWWFFCHLFVFWVFFLDRQEENQTLCLRQCYIILLAAFYGYRPNTANICMYKLDKYTYIKMPFPN